MDPELAQRFAPYLAPRETIRWAGRPVQGLAFQHGDVFMIPFSLLWLGFAVFWLWLVVTSGDSPSYFLLAGAFMVAVGAYFVAGRYLFDAHVRTKTIYAVSEGRALILSGLSGANLTVVDLTALSEMHLVPAEGGRATIVLGPRGSSLGPFTSRYEPPRSPEFFKIENAQHVYGLVQRAARKSDA